MDQAFSLVRQRRVTAAELFEQHSDPFKMLGKDVVCCCECRAPVMLRGSEGGLMRPHFAHYPIPAEKIDDAVPCDSRVTSGSESYIRREQKKYKAYGIGYLMRNFDLYQILALNNAVAPGTPMFPRLETWHVDTPITDSELRYSPSIPNKAVDMCQAIDCRLRFKLTQPSETLSKALIAEELLVRQGLKLTKLLKTAIYGSVVVNENKDLDICKCLKDYYTIDKKHRGREMREKATASGEFNDAMNAKAAEISLDIMLLAASRQNERLVVSAFLSVYQFCLSYAVQRFRAKKQAAFEPWGREEGGEFILERDELFEFLTDLRALQTVFLMDQYTPDGKRRDKQEQDVSTSDEEKEHPDVLSDWITMNGELWFAPLAYHGLWFINMACWLYQSKGEGGGLMSVFEALEMVQIKGYDINVLADNYAMRSAIILAPYLLQEMPFDELFADMLADPDKADRYCGAGEEDGGFIYLAHDKALDMLWGKATVKLGKSTDPERRGRQLAGQLLAKPLKIHRVWPVTDRHKAEQLVFNGLKRKRAAANRELFHGDVIGIGAKVDTMLKSSGLLVEVPA